MPEPETLASLFCESSPGYAARHFQLRLRTRFLMNQAVMRHWMRRRLARKRLDKAGAGTGTETTAAAFSTFSLNAAAAVFVPPPYATLRELVAQSTMEPRAPSRRVDFWSLPVSEILEDDVCFHPEDLINSDNILYYGE